MGMGILTLDNVSKSFGSGVHRADVLKTISLDVKEGEFLVLWRWTQCFPS
jgi:nitrate/nitrite transport system ATP-binding protein